MFTSLNKKSEAKSMENCFLFILKIFSSNQDVFEIQKRLRQSGFFSSVEFFPFLSRKDELVFLLKSKNRQFLNELKKGCFFGFREKIIKNGVERCCIISLLEGDDVQGVFTKYCFLFQKELIKFYFFTFLTSQEIEKRYENYFLLKSKVKQALKRYKENLVFYIQPIFEINESSKKTVAFEVLSRLRDVETGELLYPSQFFVVLEREPELFLSFDECVFLKAFDYFKDFEGKVIHLNFFLSFLIDAWDFLNFFADKIRAKFAFEIVEKEKEINFLFNNRAVSVLEKLRRYYLIFLDDFGDGINSLPIFFSFSVDGVKVSKNLFFQVKDLFQKDKNKEIVLRKFFDMCSSFKEEQLIFVVEGIETQEEFEFSQKYLKPLLFQGFYFCRPYPLEFSVESKIFDKKEEEKK